MELSIIKGVNEKRIEQFNKLEISNTSDLIRFFPRTYLDLRTEQLLKNAFHNDFVLTKGKVINVPVNRFLAKRGGFVKVICEQEGFIFSVIWFNQPYVLKSIAIGEEYLFYGRVQKKDDQTSIVNPSFEPCDKNFRLKGIVPQYATKNNLSQKIVRDSVKVAINVEKPCSIIPINLQVKYELMNLYSAYQHVHNPNNFEILDRASERIAIEEYFALISAFKFLKGGKENVRINRYSCSSTELLKFISKFPFEFTDGQKKAVNEIFADINGSRIMNRLMQGDVGSGKTAVAMCAMYMAVNSGYQVAMLAPTEVLAVQNYNIIKEYFNDYNVSLLVGSQKAKEKDEVKKELKQGNINIIVGTHALLQDSVEFKKLSLCICDEQQRFGVAQRSSLLNKGVAPDVLVMSATPIPRTLSLIFYGDLDITEISDKPKIREEIQTNIVPYEKYGDMLKFIDNEVKKGNQVYLVSPKIEGDEDGELISVKELYDEIKEIYSNFNVGLLHGKMKESEKTSVMNSFKNKEVNILVSTTVIEVGVDVPDATIMVIYNSERFGLSQLHQLRGRVGRSDKKSYCFLLTNSTDGNAIERLKILKNNSDGFKISEYDYKFRGGGDFMGVRQSGKLMKDLGFLNYDTSAIFLAKKLSDETFEMGANLDKIREVAIRKYNKLKDLSFN